MDAAFAGWVPLRRAQVHRTHGELIGARAETDHAALTPLPAQPYLVAETHLRRVGRDCLVSFEASSYSVPAQSVRAGQRVAPDTVAISALAGHGSELLAIHRRAQQRGQWVVDDQHWASLPDGHTRAVTLESHTDTGNQQSSSVQPDPLAALLARNHAAATPVAIRPLAAYDALAGLGSQGRGENR